MLKLPPSKLIKQEKRPRRPMEQEERERFLRRIYQYAPKVTRKGRHKSHPLGTAGRFYELMHFSLLRRGEAWEVTLRWVDRKSRMLHIPAEHSKSGDPESMPLHPRAERVLLEQARVAGVKATSRSLGRSTSGRRSPGRWGRRRSTRTGSRLRSWSAGC